MSNIHTGFVRRVLGGRGRALMITVALLLFWPAASAIYASAGTTAIDQLAGSDPYAGAAAAGSEVDTVAEPAIAVNPADPDNAVVAYMEGVNSGGDALSLGLAITFNGGHTWTPTQLKLNKAQGGVWGWVADPWVAFGPSGHVYVSFIGSEPSTDMPQGVGLLRSEDGGRTWTDSLRIDDPGQGHDTDSIVVDNGTGPGHHPRRIYAAWTLGGGLFGGVMATYSDDSGDHWMPPVLATPNTDEGTLAFDDRLLVLDNGDLGLWSDTGSGQTPVTTESYVFTRAPAPDPGQPLVFTPAMHVNNAQWNADSSNAATQNAAALDPAAVAVNPATGVISAAWSDGRFRSDGANDIVLAQSHDEGATWSAPVRVNHDSTTDSINHFMPMLSQTSGGALRIAYRQRLQGPNPEAWSWNVDTYLQQSTGDAAFGGATRLSSVRTDLRFAATHAVTDALNNVIGAQYFLGDYSQAASAGSVTYVVRAEAYSTAHEETASWPPAVTHQRIWVAVVR
jgi:hypothetical protein